MRTYSEFQPTGFDPRGLGLEDKQEWFVFPVSRNRDSEALTESNWRVSIRDLNALAEPETWELHRFGHWACGWFEIVIVQPGTAAAKLGETTENALADYPVLDEHDFSELEHEQADAMWRHMRQRERVDYIRENRSQFEFQGFADMLGCARGKYFAGYASELLGG